MRRRRNNTISLKEFDEKIKDLKGYSISPNGNLPISIMGNFPKILITYAPQVIFIYSKDTKVTISDIEYIEEIVLGEYVKVFEIGCLTGIKQYSIKIYFSAF